MFNVDSTVEVEIYKKEIEDMKTHCYEIEKKNISFTDKKDFYEGNILTPLCIFPEGTTTNGKYILKFKKGAFYALLPIKPQIILLDDNLDYSVLFLPIPNSNRPEFLPY